MKVNMNQNNPAFGARRIVVKPDVYHQFGAQALAEITKALPELKRAGSGTTEIVLGGRSALDLTEGLLVNVIQPREVRTSKNVGFVKRLASCFNKPEKIESHSNLENITAGEIISTVSRLYNEVVSKFHASSSLDATLNEVNAQRRIQAPYPWPNPPKRPV